MMHFQWIVSEMETRGYAQADMMDVGGDYPGLLMKNEGTGVEMEIRLRAPLFSDKGYSIVVANHNNHTAIVMHNSASDDNKRLLSKYLEQGLESNICVFNLVSSNIYEYFMNIYCY